MGNIVTKKQMLDYLTESAKSYVVDAKKSIRRSKHMHKYKKGAIPQTLVEAVVVDFINYVALGQGLDWGLYTHYLHDEKPLEGPGSEDNGCIQLEKAPIDLGDLSKRLFERAKILRGKNTLKSNSVIALEEVASVFRQASWGDPNRFIRKQG